MAKKYEVILVSPKEYDAVAKSDPRYRNVGDSMGFADPLKQRAYVRNTNVMELNKYLIEHEFEHLLEEHATDEDEHGIRHKSKFVKFLGDMGRVSAAPFTGGLSLSKGQRDAIGQAIPNELQAALPAIGGALGSFGGPTTGAAGAAAGQYAQNLFNPYNQSLGTGLLKSAAMGGIAGGVNKIASSFVGPGAGTGAARTTNTVGASGSAAPIASNSPMSGFSASSTPGGGTIGKNALTQSLFQSGGGGTSVSGTVGHPGYQNTAFQTKPSFGISNPLQNPYQSSPASPLSQFGGAATGSLLGQALTGSAKPTTAAPTMSQFTQAQAPQAQATQMPPAGTPPPPGMTQATQGASQAGGQQSLQDMLTAGVDSIKKALGLSGTAGQPGVGNFGQIALGTGLAGIGQFMGPKTPEVPDISSQFQSVLDASKGGASPLGQLAQTKLSDQLSQSYGGLNPDVRGGVKRQFDQLRQQITSQFKMFRPNADLATDSQYRQTMTDLDQRESETAAQLEMQDKQTFTTNRRADIQQALGVDEQTLSQLQNMAQLSVEELVQSYNMDVQKARDFKNQFGALGGAVASQGLGVNSFQVNPTSGQQNQAGGQPPTGGHP